MLIVLHNWLNATGIIPLGSFTLRTSQNTLKAIGKLYVSGLYIYIYTYIYTHNDTHTYIYIHGISYSAIQGTVKTPVYYFLRRVLWRLENAQNTV